MKASKNLNEQAVNTLKSKYRKMLLIDIEADTYYAIACDIDDTEWNPQENFSRTKLSDYFQWFFLGDKLHQDDRERFKQFCADLKIGGYIIYRREIDNEWRYMLLEILPNIADITGRTALLVTRDINDIYSKELDKAITVDQFTGLENKKGLDQELQKLANATHKIGFIYADINGLKYTNDNYGHSEGDKLIIRFANILCKYFPDYQLYHLSGDEFVVMGVDVALTSFLHRAIDFHKDLWRDVNVVPIASVGYSVDYTNSPREVISSAEYDMYADKQIFYSKFPEYNLRGQ